jgi:hypothetical protein
MSHARTPEEWGDAYGELESTYAAFAERVEELMRNLLQDEDLGYVESIWSTLKSESLVNAIYVLGREGKPVEDAFASFGDLGAVTIVTRTTAESEAICALVEREFEVDVESSLSFGDAQSNNKEMAGVGFPGRVFYDYPRIVVTLTDERRQLPEWSRFEGLRAEIRVQTLLQRAWQEVDEKVLPYVWDSSYPDAVQDLIVRAATTLAEADDELARIGETTDEIEAAYEHSLDLDGPDGLDTRIDLSALYVYIQSSATIARLVAAAEEAGMHHDPDPPYVSETHLWLVRRCGLSAVRELDRFCQESEPRAYDVYRRLVELVRAEDESVPWASPGSILEWLLLVLTRADADVVALTRYRPPIENALNTLIGNRVER